MKNKKYCNQLKTSINLIIKINKIYNNKNSTIQLRLFINNIHHISINIPTSLLKIEKLNII